jgi:hypothetical protein
MNMSFIKMVRLTNEGTKKGEQHKLKKNNFFRKGEIHLELTPLAS